MIKIKRDINTIREILSRLDSYEDKEITDDKLIYHLKLLIDSKYIEASTLREGNTVISFNLNLTEKGYDLLTHISNKTVWDAINDKLHENGFTVNDVPIDIIMHLSQKIMKEMFEGK